MNTLPQGYVPALRFPALTGWYDAVVAALVRERRFKERLVDQVALAPGMRVLDVGCGTGTLLAQLQRSCPRAEVHGLDGDPAALELARRKLAAAHLPVTLHEGMSFALPFEDGGLQRVTSSLLFHHLSLENKRRTLDEIRRVLSNEGELHLADWCPPSNAVMRMAFVPVQLLDGVANTQDNVMGRLERMLAERFPRAERTCRLATALGALAVYRCRA